MAGARQNAVDMHVVAPLAEQFPEIGVAFDPHRSAGRNYYTGICFAVYATDPAHGEHMVVDGGFTTWTQQLLSNQKERLLTSGIGTERLCSMFRADAG